MISIPEATQDTKNIVRFLEEHYKTVQPREEEAKKQFAQNGNDLRRRLRDKICDNPSCIFCLTLRNLL